MRAERRAAVADEQRAAAAELAPEGEKQAEAERKIRIIQAELLQFRLLFVPSKI